MCTVVRRLVPCYLKGRRFALGNVPKFIDELKEVIWSEDWNRGLLIREFADYLQFANDCEEELALMSFTILSWWKLQTRWRNLQMVVLHIATFAVSSAAVERAFSVLSRGFKKGDQRLEDYVESAVMLAYNFGRRESEEKALEQ